MEQTKTKRTLKVDHFYKNFNGVFHKLNEVRDLIPKFKEFYYTEKLQNFKKSTVGIINDFNKDISPLTFFPYYDQVKRWKVNWDREIAERLGLTEAHKFKIQKAVQLISDEGGVVIPKEEELERGTKSLAGELVNDAIGMLKGDQEEPELYEDEVIVKRRNYVLSVLHHVTDMLQGKESLSIKKNAEKRETVNFLMGILLRAASGKVTPEDLDLLKSSVKKDERVAIQPES